MNQNLVRPFWGKKRIRILVFFVGVALLFLLIWLFRPIHINKTIEGLKVNLDDESLYEPVTLTITGTNYMNPFAKDRFSGFLEITGYEFSKATHVLSDFYVSNHEGGSALAYRDTRADSTHPEPFVLFGNIFSSHDFEDIVILVYAKNPYLSTGLGYSSDSAVSIVTNVSSREQAVQKTLTALRLGGD